MTKNRRAAVKSLALSPFPWWMLALFSLLLQTVAAPNLLLYIAGPFLFLEGAFICAAVFLTVAAMAYIIYLPIAHEGFEKAFSFDLSHPPGAVAGERPNYFKTHILWLWDHKTAFIGYGLGLVGLVIALILTIGFCSAPLSFEFMHPVFTFMSTGFVSVFEALSPNSAISTLLLAGQIFSGIMFTLTPLAMGGTIVQMVRIGMDNEEDVIEPTAPVKRVDRYTPRHTVNNNGPQLPTGAKHSSATDTTTQTPPTPARYEVVSVGKKYSYQEDQKPIIQAIKDGPTNHYPVNFYRCGDIFQVIGSHPGYYGKFVVAKNLNTDEELTIAPDDFVEVVVRPVNSQAVSTSNTTAQQASTQYKVVGSLAATMKRAGNDGNAIAALENLQQQNAIVQAKKNSPAEHEVIGPYQIGDIYLTGGLGPRTGRDYAGQHIRAKNVNTGEITIIRADDFDIVEIPKANNQAMPVNNNGETSPSFKSPITQPEPVSSSQTVSTSNNASPKTSTQYEVVKERGSLGDKMEAAAPYRANYENDTDAAIEDLQKKNIAVQATKNGPINHRFIASYQIDDLYEIHRLGQRNGCDYIGQYLVAKNLNTGKVETIRADDFKIVEVRKVNNQATAEQKLGV